MKVSQSIQREGATRPVTARSATLIVWFHLRSPELSAEFERMMAGDRDGDRWQVQATEQVQRLAEAIAHLVSARLMLVLERVL
jgi:hypothetical protein